MKRKAGFTLVELMVVAVIVAILAAVAIPLMSGNKDRAMATEAQAGCSTVRTAVQVYRAEHDALPTGGAASTLPGIGATDLDGTYFVTANYVYAQGAGGGYTITVTGTKTDVAGETVILTVDAAGEATWSGTLLD